MPPRGGKKKGRNQDDQQFQQSQKAVASKWAEALQQIGENEADPEQLYTKPSKTIFEFDFSHQRALDLLQEPKKPQKNKFEDFTPEELQQLQKIKQKAKADKQVKNQIKNEKKKERQKQIEAQKVIEQAEKQKEMEQKKRIDEQVQKNKKKQGSPWIIPLSLLGFLVFMFFLQYQKQIYQRLSKFQNDQVDYYGILEADQSTTDKQLKNKYKKLVLKYHPDRNPDCENCKQKFDKIMMAWEVLGDEQKRKQYDQNAGFISELKSISTTLTPYNYHYLVEESNSMWLIQVFDSTSTYSKYFSQFWEELVMNYGDFIKFGRIDIWTQSEMSSYLPYNFKVFPTVYSNNKGSIQICSFNFESPSQGLKKCVQESLSKINQKVVPQVPTQSPKIAKPQVYIDGKLRGNLRVKGCANMLQQYMDFFFTQKQQVAKQATIYYSGQKHIFNFTQNSKQMMGKFCQYLQNFVIQETSTCRFLHQCDEKKCILILNRTKIDEVYKQLPLIKQNPIKIPIFALNDGTKQLQQQINAMKQHFDNFQIGIYESGRVDLGYANEADLLNPQQGERLNLECKVSTWRDKLFEVYQKLRGVFTQN